MENNGDFFLRLPRPFEILLVAFQKVRRSLGGPIQCDPSARGRREVEFLEAELGRWSF